jgi:hypothetical protein
MTEVATRGRPFPTGLSGNPNGRPVGHHTRYKFSASFLADLAEVWAEHGKATMLRTVATNPETFFATCARLLPKDVELTIRSHYSFELDPADLAILKAIKENSRRECPDPASGAAIHPRCNSILRCWQTRLSRASSGAMAMAVTTAAATTDG